MTTDSESVRELVRLRAGLGIPRRVIARAMDCREESIKRWEENKHSPIPSLAKKLEVVVGVLQDELAKREAEAKRLEAITTKLKQLEKK